MLCVQALIFLTNILDLRNCSPPALGDLFEALVDLELDHLPQHLCVKEDNDALVQLLHILRLKGRFESLLGLLLQLSFHILYLKHNLFNFLHALNLQTVILTLNHHGALLDSRGQPSKVEYLVRFKVIIIRQILIISVNLLNILNYLLRLFYVLEAVYVKLLLGNIVDEINLDVFVN